MKKPLIKICMALLASSLINACATTHETQQLFTAPTQQLLWPEMLATEVNQEFYKAFAQSGISRGLTEGLAKNYKTLDWE